VGGGKGPSPKPVGCGPFPVARPSFPSPQRVGVRGVPTFTPKFRSPSPARFARDLSPTGRGENKISFSRCGFASELWDATSRKRETEREVRQVVEPALVLRSSPRRKSVARMKRSEIRGRRCRFDLAPGLRYAPPGLPKRKKSEAKRRQTQGSSAVPYGHGRASNVRRTSIGVPPRFSSQGVFHRKGLSLRPCFLGPGLSG
jgi:hypothetical protein